MFSVNHLQQSDSFGVCTSSRSTVKRTSLEYCGVAQNHDVRSWQDFTVHTAWRFQKFLLLGFFSSLPQHYFSWPLFRADRSKHSYQTSFFYDFFPSLCFVTLSRCELSFKHQLKWLCSHFIALPLLPFPNFFYRYLTLLWFSREERLWD